MLNYFYSYSEFNSILSEKKSKKLTLILFYSEYSMAFLKVQSVFKKIIEDITLIGTFISYVYKIYYTVKECCIKLISSIYRY